MESSDTNNKTAIVVRHLTKRFGDFTAVSNLSLDVMRGEIFGFLGPNGSGKTTTIRMMLGLLPPSEGTIRILNTPIHTNAASIRPRVGYMSQRFSLYDDLTVLENLRFYGRAYGLTKKTLNERIDEAVRMADLTGRENTLTDELSGGGRQRLSLGAAILHQPELIFLDEPTAGVDPISRRAFWDLLYTLASRGVTVFVTTHYMDEAEHCHKLALIREGQIFAQGSNAQIKQDLIPGPVLEITTPDAGKVIRLIREAKREGRLPDVQVALYGSRIHVLGGVAEPLQTMVADVLRRVQIENFEISMIEPSLEDVFIACIG